MDQHDPIADLKTRQSLLEKQILVLQRRAEQISIDLRSISDSTEKAPQNDIGPDPFSPSAPAESQPETSPTPPPVPRPLGSLSEPTIKQTPTPPSPASQDTSESSNWELELGKIWFVRIGILSLLTGLVFLSTYAYNNWLALASANTRISAFMTISLALTGFGMIFEKKKRDLRHYGRVITAGGLAAAYYTIYAAHFVPSLKILSSPALAATLLTLWAGIMLLYACWKKSRIVATISLGLAFYATIMNPTGWLSIFSALLLSASGTFLLLKYKWIHLGIATVAAAYISHAFWLGIYPHHVSDPTRFTYLGAYWLLFTTALTLPSARKIPRKSLNIFAALNNSAAWALTAFTLPALLPHPHIAKISIAIGTIYLAIAYLAKKQKIFPPSLCVTYAYQSIFLITFGIIIASAGYNRFIILAAEACLLLAAGHRHRNKLVKIASAPVYAIALISAIPLNSTPHPWPAYLALALISAAYTIIIRRTAMDTAQSRYAPLAIIPAATSWLILALGVTRNWEIFHSVPSLLTFTLALTLLHLTFPRLHHLRDLIITTPIPILLATFWHIDSPYPSALAPVALFFTIPALLTTYWFLTPHIHNLIQKTFHHHSPTIAVKHDLLGIGIGAAVTLTTLSSIDNITSWHNAWIILPGITAIILHAISDRTKRLSLTIPALILHPFAVAGSLQNILGTHNPAIWIPTILITTHLILNETLLTSLKCSISRPLFALTINLAIAIPLLIHTTSPAVPLTLVAISFYTFARMKTDNPTEILGAKTALIIAYLAALPHLGQIYLITYIPLIVGIVLHALPPLKSPRHRIWKTLHSFSLAATLIYLFTTITSHTLTAFHGSGLTIAWALLALSIFAIGLAMNYRPYRHAGIAFLFLATANLVIADVMKFETLARILAFISLGLTLITLGYLYNRFQDQIKKFL